MAGAHRRRRPDRADPHPPEAARCSTAPPSAAPAGVPRGAYVLVDEDGDALDLVLIGTGSEVSVCVAARDAARGRRPRRCASCRCRRGTCSRRSPTTYRDDGAAARRARRSRSRPASTLRLGALRRRRRRHRPLRRVGARATSRCEKFGYHPRARRRARAARCSRTGGTSMTQRDRPAERLRAEPLVRQPHPRRCSPAAGCAKLVDDDGIRGVTSNPTIFEKAMAPARATTSSSRELRRGRRCRSRTRTGSSSIDDIADGDRRPAPGLRRGATAATASCRSRCRPTSRTTPTATIAQAQSLFDRARPARTS